MRAAAAAAAAAAALAALAARGGEGAGPHVDVRWNVLAGQYFLADEAAARRAGGFDLEVGPDPVEVLGAAAPAEPAEPEAPLEGRNNNNGTADARDGGPPLEALRPTPAAAWTFRKLDARATTATATRYRVTVRATSTSQEPASFRLGLAPAHDVKPGSALFREWMVDNRCLWYLAGRPDEAAELNGDRVWGAYSQDGCVMGDELTMEVDLENAQVGFSVPEETCASADRDSCRAEPPSATSSPQLRFSIDGFAPISVSGLDEKRDHVSMTQGLLINGASFNFETSNFGPDLPLGRAIVQSLVIANPIDACDPFSRAVAQTIRGKVVFALRGGCDFLDKVLNAQDAGAIAVIVADHKEPRRAAGRGGGSAKPKGKGAKQQGKQGRNAQSAAAAQGDDAQSHPFAQGDIAEDFELVIMDHINRHEDAAQVRIPSVFVSNAADLYIAALHKAGRALKVVLRGSIDAPAHHGLHWREHGLSPAVWLGPNTNVQVTAEPIDGAALLASEAPCRPLVYLPLAISERETLLANVRGVAVSRDMQNVWGARLSKRLAAHAQICGESVAPAQSYWSLRDAGTPLIPWTADTAQERQRVRRNKAAAQNDFELGWGLTDIPTLAQFAGTKVPSNFGKLCASKAVLGGTDGTQAISLTGDTSRPTACSFVYGMAKPRRGDAGVLRVAPREDLLGSVLRAPLAYFWNATLVSPKASKQPPKMEEASEDDEPGEDDEAEEQRDAGAQSSYAAIGVVAEPVGSAGEFWAITSSGRSLLKGREVSISSSSADINAALRWTNFAGVLLDLGDMTLTIFTSADHSRWVSFALRATPDALPPVMGARDETDPAFGVTPFLVLESGRAAEISELATPARAAEVLEQRRANLAHSKCVQAHAGLTICTKVPTAGASAA